MRWWRPLLVVNTRSSSGHVCGQQQRPGREVRRAGSGPLPRPVDPRPAGPPLLVCSPHLLPVDGLLGLLLDLLLGDARLHRHLPPVARETLALTSDPRSEHENRVSREEKLEVL